MLLQHKQNKSLKEKILLVIFYIFTIVWALFLLIPLTWMCSSAFKNQVSVFKMPPKWIPSTPLQIVLSLNYTKSQISDEIVKRDAAKAIWIGQDKFQARTDIQKMQVLAVCNDTVLYSAEIPFYEAKQLRKRLLNQTVLDAAAIEEQYLDLMKYAELTRTAKPWREEKSVEADSLLELADTVMRNVPFTGKILQTALKKSHTSFFDSFKYGFKYAFSKGSDNIFFGRFLFNSFWVVFCVIVLQLTISSLAGYALAYLLPKWLSRTLLIFFMATMMIPPLLLFMPLILILRSFPLATIPFTSVVLPHFNILDSYWALILPHTAWGLAIYLFMGFFKQIPKDLLDAARIDGCTEWSIFYKIVLPISKPVFGVMTLWTFYAVWPSFLWPYILSFFQDMTKWTFPVALFFAEAQTPYPNIIMAVSVLATIPTIIFFFIFQSSIQRGLVWSGIKG